MKKEKSKTEAITYRSLGVITLVLVVVYAVIPIISSQPQIPEPIQRTRNNNHLLIDKSPVTDQNKKGFHGYDAYRPWFDLTLPHECIIGNAKIITCTTTNFTLNINPQAGGRGVLIKEQTEVTINTYTWKRTIIDPQTEQPTTSAYALVPIPYHESNLTEYLIEVKHDPYSPESQQYFENILSTFRFIE